MLRLARLCCLWAYAGRGADHKVPVFGIIERNGVVKVDAVKDVTASSLLNMTIKTVRRGSIVCTDKFRSYDMLMFCGNVNHREKRRRKSMLGQKTLSHRLKDDRLSLPAKMR
jgi:transposase